MIYLALFLVTALGDKLSFSEDGTGDITTLELNWRNPDLDLQTEFTADTPYSYFNDQGQLVNDGQFDMSKLVDSVFSSNPVGNPAGFGKNWGEEPNPTGLDFKISAELRTGGGTVYWDITSVTLVFSSKGGDCFSASSDAELRYTEYGTNKAKTKKLSFSQENTQVTFSATGNFKSEDDITVALQAKEECREQEILIHYFELEGVAVSTPSPTHSPTKSPTSRPTMSPTKTCNGLITWGDPHFHPVAIDNKDVRFDYQAMGWHYYLAPCDDEDYEAWPVFLLGFHEPWKNNKKAAVMGDNMIILNTSPKQWIIQYEQEHYSSGKSWFDVQVGSDVHWTQSKFNNDFSRVKDYSEKKPFRLEYDDGKGQSGVLLIYEGSKSGDEKIYFEFEDLSYTGGPTEDCSGEQFQLSHEGYWFYITCPKCLRDVACGIMGRFTRGDCDMNDLKNANSDCHDILVKSDGVAVDASNFNNKDFEKMAETWTLDNYHDAVTAAGHDPFEITFTKNKDSLKMHAEAEARMEDFEGNQDTDGEGNLLPLGECRDNDARIAEIDELCHQNTLVKYAECCKEIGICQGLYETCIFDVCGCVGDTDENGVVFDDNMCVEMIVHQSMNTSCTTAALFPTNSPTAAPTKAPTRTVVKLIDDDQDKEKVSKVQKLIGIYSIFVVLFLVIAIGSFCYYKRRQKGVAYFNEMEDAQMTGAGV